MRIALLALLFIAGLTGCNGQPETEFEKTLRLAEQGDLFSQFKLGSMYYKGEGVPQNYAEAFEWQRKAAEQGYAGAQHALGFMYSNGEGVSEDDAEAVKWFRKAAEQGLPLAQYNLGSMYYKGEGVPQDYVEAYAWFSVAATKGQGSVRIGQAEARLKIFKAKAQLTPEQLTEAQRRATQLFEQIKANKQYSIH